jgi:hypothetical protein
MSASPYEVLGVDPAATDEELRQAYRRMLRESHPDTGGTAARFVQVQRAWERIGTPEQRSTYDRSQQRDSPFATDWAPSRAPAEHGTRPTARSHGHPGGWRRERYLTLMREWVGRGVDLDRPYDPELVRRAPREIRHILADALAEEATARALASLGIGFTLWHDVSTGDPDEKIDHVVLGPTGLFAIQSEDYGGPVAARRGELVGDALADDEPVRDLSRRARGFARSVRVRFTALLIVLPDEDLAERIVDLGRHRGSDVAAVRRTALLSIVRDGLPGGPVVGGTRLFDLRDALQRGIRFV